MQRQCCWRVTICLGLGKRSKRIGLEYLGLRLGLLLLGLGVWKEVSRVRVRSSLSSTDKSVLFAHPRETPCFLIAYGELQSATYQLADSFL